MRQSSDKLEFLNEEGCEITQSELARTFRGVSEAANLENHLVEPLVQWICSRTKPLPDMTETTGHYDQKTSTGTFTFVAWRAAAEYDLSQPHERALLTLALAVAYLRNKCCGPPRSDNIHLPDQLSFVWNLVRDAVMQLSPRLTVSRSAQGFLAVPLCSLIADGHIDELWRLHVWQPDGQRGDAAFGIHSHQCHAQSWVLAGVGTDHSYTVTTTAPVAGDEQQQKLDAADLISPTHNTYRLIWDDGKSKPSAVYKTHQQSSTVVNTRCAVSATLDRSERHVRDATYTIPAGAFHGSEVDPYAFHATLFLFDAGRGFVPAAPVLGPLDRNAHTQLRDPTGAGTAADLARTVEAIRAWEALMGEGKHHERDADMELVLQAYDRALSLCDDVTAALPDPPRYRARVFGELGGVNRRFGRYVQAVDYLERALDNIDNTTCGRDDLLHGLLIRGELGVVYRHMGRLDDAKRVLEDQYAMSKTLDSDREMCRAVGNLGMVNYQLYLQNGHAPLLQEAIGQQTERIKRARRLGSSLWECIGLSRLSLLYTADGRTGDAVDVASKALSLVLEGNDTTATAMSRFYYARALLSNNQRDDALRQVNTPNTCTAAMAFCKEPSEEHNGYLRELIHAGAETNLVDEHGYTALRLCRVQRRCVDCKAHHGRLKEARIRKGYREIFQERFRPALLGGGGESSLRGGLLRKLRRVYAEALASDDTKRRQFDGLKFVRYTDFVRFGGLPRSSDGVTKRAAVKGGDISGGGGGGGSEVGPDDDNESVDFIIFFSYRWINKDPVLQTTIGGREEQYLRTPDDENKTQYSRMIRATEDLLQLHPDVNKKRLGIWVDFSCVDQDQPNPGVHALPMIVAQCDVVISLVDDEYYHRAWCAVEVMFIQRLVKSYRKHLWYEHVAVTNGEYVLREGPIELNVSMAQKKLSYEEDRPKVLFLERQGKLLGY
ncbi:hypothetical protein PG989_006412 [Apiospora arundinis]